MSLDERGENVGLVSKELLSSSMLLKESNSYVVI